MAARRHTSDAFTSFRRRGFDGMGIWGLLVTVALHGGVVGLLYLRRDAEAHHPPPADSFVVARLVRLGRKREAHRLPQKIVPRSATKEEEAVSYDAESTDPPKPPPKNKPNRDAQLSDRIQHSLDKADLLEQAQAEIEAEGDPDGVAGGTATEATDGDPYITRIADLWNRTWTLPAIIPREDAKQLSVLMVLRIDREGNIQFPIEFDKSSGNGHFDDSVRVAWQQIRKLPVPPPERQASILANGLALKLTWKGLQ